MLRILRKLARGRAAGALALLASAVLLSAGLFIIFATLSDDNVHLPSEGSLEEILRDAVDGGVDDTLGGSLDDGLDDGGIGLEGMGVSAAARADPTPPAAAASPAPPPPPPPAPVAIAIPHLDVEAPVVPMGLDADRYPEVPDGPDQVAWYTFTAAPGQSSNAVFAAHVDWVAGMEAIFYRLSELEIDDVITVTLEDGSQLGYRVTGNVAIPYDDPSVVKAMEGSDKDVITLITCGGTWQRDRSARFGGNYSHRIIVRAERVVEAQAGLLAAPDTV